MPEKVVHSTLSPNYVSHWTQRQALREFIQNAIDSATQHNAEYSDCWNNGVATISDTGEGIDLRHLVMGISEKGERAIGQFGEGLKLGLLVFSRNDVTIRVRSKNMTITPMIDRHPDLETDVLAFIIENGYDNVGTTVEVACSKEDFTWAREQFEYIYMKETKAKVVAKITDEDSDLYNFEEVSASLPGGKVFLNGQLLPQGTFWGGRTPFFTWHIRESGGNRESMSRDRNTINPTKLLEAMQGLILQSHVLEIAKALVPLTIYEVKNDFRIEKFLEHDIHWSPDCYTEHIGANNFKKEVIRLFGKKIVMHNGDNTAHNQAVWEGYTVLTCERQWKNFYISSEAVARIEEAISLKPRMEVVPLVEMSALQKVTANSAINAINRLVGEAGYGCNLVLGRNVFFSKDLKKGEAYVDGVCSSENGQKKIYISFSFLDWRDTSGLCSVLLHEAAHYITGGEDCSPIFVRFLQTVAGYAVKSRVRI